MLQIGRKVFRSMLKKKQKKSSNNQNFQVNRSQDSQASTLTNQSLPKYHNKKLNLKKTNLLEYSSSDQEDWKTELTRSVRKDESELNGEADKTKTGFKRKYPKQVKNIKAGTVQVKSKENSNSRFQDLCAICLDKYSNVRGYLGCGHKFCFECIEEWIKSSTRCPCCREKFSDYVKVTVDQNNVQKKREIIEVEEKVLEFNQLDWYICYECDNGDDEDVLLVCDICQFYCCHVYCDRSLHNLFPEGEWYCQKCKEMLQNSEKMTKKQTTVPIKRQKKESKKVENNKKKKEFDTESESDNDYDNEETPFNGRMTRSMSNNQINIGRRSKAYEIINMRPNPTINNFAAEMQRVTNSTAMNLRNLRRRRIS